MLGAVDSMDRGRRLLQSGKLTPQPNMMLVDDVIDELGQRSVLPVARWIGRGSGSDDGQIRAQSLETFFQLSQVFALACSGKKVLIIDR